MLFRSTEMVFTPHQQESDLVRNRYGLLEPDKPCQTVSMTEMDLVLVPMVACDHDGTRLGMGGGYYDRFFAAKLTDRAADPFLLGIAHDFQLLAHIPRQQWDVPLDAIATPGGITYFRKV